jgi:hypothetical protein
VMVWLFEDHLDPLVSALALVLGNTEWS